MLALTITVAAAIVLLMLYGVVALLLAKAVVYPQRARPTEIIDVKTDGTVTLGMNPLTRFDGVLGLLYNDEKRLAVLEPGADIDETQARVVRQLVEPVDLELGTTGRAAGNIFTPTNVLRQSPAEVQIASDPSPQPAWLFAGSGADASTWVIHVHGMLAGRDSALRSVRAMASTGYTSLVVSYRGDGEAGDARRVPSTLGQAEWRDLDAAVGFARGRGATKVVIMGWSLGASIALEETRRGTHGDAIDALVLISPVISWAQTIHYGMARQRIPRWLASSAMALLSSPFGVRILGLPFALEFPTGLPPATRPTLILHSSGDLTTPFATSQAYAATSSLVTLEEFAASPHAMEWNADPEHFAVVTRSWLVAHLQQKKPDSST